MIELFGLRTDYEYNIIGEAAEAVEVRDLVATFASKELAESYVQSSYLKSAKREYFRPDVRGGKYSFSAKSLLRHYADYEICDPDLCEYTPPPHNPTL